MREAPEPIHEVDLLISAGCIITMNSRRQIILDGAVAVSGTDIVAVGDAREIRTRYRARKTIDAPQGLMTPGLVDVHNHPIDYLIKGLCDDTPQLQRLRERLIPHEEGLTEEGNPPAEPKRSEVEFPAKGVLRDEEVEIHG